MESFPWKKAIVVIGALVLAVILGEMARQGSGVDQSKFLVENQPIVPVSYSEFKTELKGGNVKDLTFLQTSVTGTFRSPHVLAATGKDGAQKTAMRFSTSLPPVEDPELWSLINSQGVSVSVTPKDEGSALGAIFFNMLPFILIIAFWIWMSRRAQKAQMGPFGNFGKVDTKVGEEKVPNVRFEDVAGMETQKLELTEIVDFLKSPERYERIGGRVPKGVLLMGPPGSGKTLLAKAVAGEAGVPFFSTTGSEFIEMFVGVGASRVRDLFAKARAKAPSIIFIDEIDAVGRHRGAGLGGGHDEREQTLNQLLSEMDGFEGHERVIVLAATNRPDVLDSALLRPGRFDRQVVIDLPTLEDREAILKVHTRKIPLDPDADLRLIARSTPGMSGADLENLCNEAALFAARAGAQTVNAEHFDLAKDKIMMGLERPGLKNESERKITAFHEAGHTLVATLIEGMDPVHKVTILPRGVALGVTHLVPLDDRHYYPKQYLMGRLSVNMGGRAAELIFFNETSTGAQSDLRASTDLAEKMVCQWGMSERVGPVTFSRGEEHVFLGKKLAQDKTWSEQMGWIIDQEVEAIVRQAEKNALSLIEEHKDTMERLANTLLEREELSGEEVNLVIAGKPLPPKPVKAPPELPAPAPEPAPAPLPEPAA
jgi:cell division protease FtsH